MKKPFCVPVLVACLLLGGLCQRSAPAQALPTASGAGSYTSVGGGVSVAPSAYDNRDLGGGVVFADIQPDWHFGFEAEARFLRLNTDEGVDQTNYLAGIRMAVHPARVRPYAKFLVGATQFSAPFGYGRGTFFTLAPGGGIDCFLTDRISVRLADVEYQVIPDFIGSNVRKLGVSMGLSVRVNGVNRLPTRSTFSKGRFKRSSQSEFDGE